MAEKGEISKLKAWLIVLAALLDDVAALVLIFVILWFFDVKLPLSAIIAIGLVLGTFIFIVHRAVVPSLRRKKVTGAEGMIGLTGEVVQSLKPKGVVKIKGEYWKAESNEGEIDVGGDVEVVGIKSLSLEVRRRLS
jgi:membrane-bound serine protease (ClpP class)